MQHSRRDVLTSILLVALAVTVVSCQPSELSVDDFSFQGPLGSQGARIRKLGQNEFKVSLGHAPEHPDWPNKLNFRILRHARGHDLRLVVEGPPRYSFNEYFQSWSYDAEHWQPIHWENGYQVSQVTDTLQFPVFTEDQVYCGTQVPLSFVQIETMIHTWEKSPYVRVHTVGTSLEGRPLYRVEITDPRSPYPRSRRWVHYFANQHPGEHNSQWRIVGMIRWLLSDAARDVRQRSICYFIPIMSPDAPSHGWYRVNGEGVDMNRSYRAAGADSTRQAHEAYLWQRDLEHLMASDAPVTTVWAMHTWQGRVEPLLSPGPEMAHRVKPWTALRDLIEQLDTRDLIKPLAVRENAPDYGASTWSGGPHQQFGVTAVLCEGGGDIETKEANLFSGRILMESIARYYTGTK